MSTMDDWLWRIDRDALLSEWWRPLGGFQGRADVRPEVVKEAA